MADYLENQTDAHFWGIEDSPPPEEVSPPISPDLARGMRQQRFRRLVRQASDRRIDADETARFLEQFRYSIVGSHLLESKPLYTTWSGTKIAPEQRRFQLFMSIRGPWDAVRMPSKIWVGGGGCVVVVAVLVFWRSKYDKSNVAFTAFLLVGLFLFAHSRRRLVRQLRSKVLGRTELFVDASRSFDGDVVRCLRLIQEVDLIDQGFKSGATPSPRQMASRGAKRLRAVLSSSLNIAVETYLEAISEVLHFCSELDLQQMFEVYDLMTIQQNLGFVMNDDFVGFLGEEAEEMSWAGPKACYTPLSYLKNQFRKLHFLRRAFLCCLMVIPSTGYCDATEIEAWSTVLDHLKHFEDLSHELSRVIVLERFDPVANNDRISNKAPAPRERHSAKLLMLSSVAQHLAARIELFESSPDELRGQKRAIESEVREIQRLWAQVSLEGAGRSYNQEYPQVDAEDQSVASESELIADTSSTLVSTPSDISFSESFPESYPTLLQTEVSAKPKQNIPRGLRIEQMRISRENEAKAEKDRRAAAAAHTYFMNELESVLRHRSQLS